MKGYKHYSGTICTRTGAVYPDFAIGTYRRTKEELFRLLQKYPYDILMLDTAYRYGNEPDVAAAVQESGYPPRQVLYTGKINTSQQESGRSVREELLGTLNRLQIPNIDIYLIHSSRSPHCCRTWKQMIALREEGLIRTIGVSNFDVDALERLFDTSGFYPEIHQMIYRPDSHCQKLLQFCREKGILVQIAMPFGGEENRTILSSKQREKILMQLRQQGLMCIFGTTSIDHLSQNLMGIQKGRLSAVHG